MGVNLYLQGIYVTVYAAEVFDNRITSAGAIVVDYATGMELYSYNADVCHGPASMTKMMTVYLVCEAIADGKIDFGTCVTISQGAYEMSLDPVLAMCHYRVP